MSAGWSEGTVTLNYGSYGGVYATTTVTGLAWISSSMRVEAWKRGEATADHSFDEVCVEPFDVTAGNVTAGVGFQIVAICTHGTTSGDFKFDWVVKEN